MPVQIRPSAPLMKELTQDQRKLISESLANLSVALITVGAITPLFIKVEDVVKLGLQVLGSLIVGSLLFLVAVRNLRKKGRKR